MSFDAQKPWLVDGRTGQVWTYGELWDEVSGGEQRLHPWFRPKSTREALLEIVRVLVTESEITLFDADFAATEVQALGYAEEQLLEQRTVRCGGIASVEALAGRIGSNSGARINLFTSGSTGLPKLVRHSLESLARGVRTGAKHVNDVWAFAYNPTHVAGVQVFLQALANGNTLVDVFGLARANVLAACETHGVTHLSATPTFYRLLLPVERTLPGVRGVTLGGESSDRMLHDKLRELFPSARLHNIYASTEAGTLLVAQGDIFSIPAALAGRIAVRNGHLHIHRSLTGELGAGAGADEWYDSGDVVEVVEADPLRFRIVARERDWVNVGGSKVNPHEIEARLCGHPAVAQARVFGRKNSVLGQILCADVVLRLPAVTEGDLRDYLLVHLQPFKVPRMITFVSTIEATRSGKISRV